MIRWLSTKHLPQTSIRKQLIDQTGHALGGAAIAAVAILCTLPPLAGAALACLFGYFRELDQQGIPCSSHGLMPPINLGRWATLDIIFWLVGGLLAAATFLFL